MISIVKGTTGSVINFSYTTTLDTCLFDATDASHRNVVFAIRRHLLAIGWVPSCYGDDMLVW